MPADTAKPLELEGMVTAMNVLRVLTADLDAVTATLDQRIAAAPGLFENTPLVIDLSALDAEPAEGAASPGSIPLSTLLDLLKTRGLIPVGVRATSGARAQEAAAAGLGVIDSAAAARAPRRAREKQSGTEPPPPAVEPVRTLTIEQPLRSGQIVYAEGGDAVALAAVNAGAELIADGHIHVYAPLRGRALAGARGDESARIFCQRLEADLVSIAGVYLSSDDLPQDKRGKAVQIHLNQGELVISVL